MKALVYHGPGRKSWDTAPDPKLIEPTDILVQVDTTTICGTDLHILKGDVPTVEQGRILGHEAIGTVVATGSAVSSIAVDDRVIVPAITSCGRCSYCRRAMPSHCQATGGIGWIFGHLIDGTQAEFVRVPFAETSVHKVPEGVTDEQVLFLTDILPTGYEVGVLAGAVRPGDVVAVVGTGPVGLAAIATARLYSPSHIVAIGLSDVRLDAAKRFGADVTVNSAREDPLAVINDLTGRMGADVSIEAVGVPAAFELAVKLARPGGRIANIGVHGEPVALHLEEQWIRDITITTGLVDTSSTPTLMRLMTTGQIDAKPFITHHFDMDDFEEAYDVFARAADTGALKVVLTRGSE
jgi:alcohol dehydrogenase